MGAEEYLLDNRAAEAGGRVAAQSAIFDPVTFLHVDALGIAPWLEMLGSRGGWTVGSWWLADRVRPTGRVVATDIEIGWLADRVGGVEVARRDVVRDGPPGDGFDLVQQVCPDAHGPDQQLANKVKDGFRWWVSWTCPPTPTSPWRWPLLARWSGRM